MSQQCCMNNPCDARTHKLPIGRGMQAILDYTPPVCHQTICGLDNTNPTTYIPEENVNLDFFESEKDYHCGNDNKECTNNNTTWFDSSKIVLSTRFNDENKFRNTFINTVIQDTDMFNGVKPPLPTQ